MGELVGEGRKEPSVCKVKGLESLKSPIVKESPSSTLYIHLEETTPDVDQGEWLVH